MQEALSRKKILLVDRSKVLRKAGVAQLEKLGSVVEAVSSSSEALLKILRWYPDLIISGVEVGDINGYDLCMLLRLMPDFAGVPVIIISSGNADAVKFRAADAGADYYVKKDEQLLAMIRALCS